MTPLRILHAIRSLDPAAGGPPVVCLRLAEAQSALGHRATVIAETAPLEVRAIRLGVASGGERFLGGPVSRRLREVVRDADVLHLHGIWDSFLALAASAARRVGVPYVVMPHGMLDPWSLRQKWWKKRLALALGTRRMLRRAAALHLLYREEGDFAAALGVRTLGFVIPNGVALAEIDALPPQSEFRDSVPALGDRPYALFLGRLHHKKGLDFLAEAFGMIAARFGEFHLVVAGPEEGAGEPFRRQVESLGLTARVHLVGPLGGRRKWAALAAATCFCLPSRQEGFSVAVLEALACRVPVVISDACHFPEVATAGAGVVVPLTAATIADGLASIVSDIDRATRMGTAGRELIERNYTWERVAEQTIEMYRSVLARGAR